MSAIQRIDSLILEDQLPLLTTEISALAIAESQLTQVTTATEEARESGSQHRDTEVSAIHRISTELLCEIFALTLPYVRRIGSHMTEQAPWRLGHICQTWRAAALGNPLLWSSITLYAPPEGWMGQACPPLMIETQLRRSGDAPLRVIFDSRHGDIIDSCSPESIALIIDHSFHWETAHLHLYDSRAFRVANRLRRAKGNIRAFHTSQLEARFEPQLGPQLETKLEPEIGPISKLDVKSCLIPRFDIQLDPNLAPNFVPQLRLTHLGYARMPT